MAQVIAYIVAEATAEVIPAARVAELHAAGDHQHCGHMRQTDDDHETEVTE